MSAYCIRKRAVQVLLRDGMQHYPHYKLDDAASPAGLSRYGGGTGLAGRRPSTKSRAGHQGAGMPRRPGCLCTKPLRASQTAPRVPASKGCGSGPSPGDDCKIAGCKLADGRHRTAKHGAKTPQSPGCNQKSAKCSAPKCQVHGEGGSDGTQYSGSHIPSGRKMYKLVSGDVYLLPKYREHLAPSKLMLSHKNNFRNPRRLSKRLSRRFCREGL